ncbi:MAG TPA: hypothetical protein VHT21_05350 [Stellaceae bacterium]|nr:hypothetical protein [Stellaceae bacterium]
MVKAPEGTPILVNAFGSACDESASFISAVFPATNRFTRSVIVADGAIALTRTLCSA